MVFFLFLLLTLGSLSLVFSTDLLLFLRRYCWLWRRLAGFFSKDFRMVQNSVLDGDRELL